MSVVEIFGFPFAAGQNDTPLGLTEKQRQTVSTILAGFDGNNLSTANVQAVLAAFNDAGILPGDELYKAVREEGFDPDLLKSQNQDSLNPTGDLATNSSTDVDQS